MRNDERFIIKNWNMLVLSLSTIWYGIETIAHPDTLATYNIYQVMQEVIPTDAIGIFFIGIGLLTFLSTFSKNKLVKQYIIAFFIFAWSFYSISFFIALPKNTFKVFGLIIALVMVGETMKDVSR